MDICTLDLRGKLKVLCWETLALLAELCKQMRAVNRQLWLPQGAILPEPLDFLRKMKHADACGKPLA